MEYPTWSLQTTQLIFFLRPSVASGVMPQSKGTHTGIRNFLSDLFTCCTMWVHVRQDACDASQVPCPCWVLLAGWCWVLLDAAGCCWLGAGLLAGCCVLLLLLLLLGAAQLVKRVLGLCSYRGALWKAMPWPHRMIWVLTVAHMRVLQTLPRM